MKVFTCFKDANGTDIHDGDTIRAKYGCLYTVYLDPGSGEWCARDATGHNIMELGKLAPYCVVEAG
jgi:hypothetical protein